MCSRILGILLLSNTTNISGMGHGWHLSSAGTLIPLLLLQGLNEYRSIFGHILLSFVYDSSLKMSFSAFLLSHSRRKLRCTPVILRHFSSLLQPGFGMLTVTFSFLEIHFICFSLCIYLCCVWKPRIFSLFLLIS